MYIHPQHRFDHPAALQALVADHALGAWVCAGPAGLVANHVPFFLDRSRGPLGTLVGHVARANPVWQALGPAVPSVVMFQGPQAYITPGWYPGHAAHGQVVPTWNYLVAHAHGVARVVDDRAALLAMLHLLTDAHESSQAAPWQMADAPAAFMDRMLGAIVGIEIPTTGWKASARPARTRTWPTATARCAACAPGRPMPPRPWPTRCSRPSMRRSVQRAAARADSGLGQHLGQTLGTATPVTPGRVEACQPEPQLTGEAASCRYALPRSRPTTCLLTHRSGWKTPPTCPTPTSSKPVH